ncbi:GNAT family N-acetyltransferase [Micromonospora yasonensis]|uniref:GNAT family N-acetyltransferase n=1 Tax=Micromonospora yasonensis TaxID=1128667 RepID=UPI0022325B02|nr:GNAT family N-acetyltransferase [Micromonospora yasonensis]MCW3844342.1 GNAT family N-acetyltransferase [Micromonospora yasonensis]
MITVVGLSQAGELRAAAALLCRIWGAGTESPPIPLDVLCALAHTGGYVAGAYLDGQLVGAAAGFRTAAGQGLHSHVVGVAPECQGRGVGFAIKQHQRRWAQEAGLDHVSWTFDPLVRRNAYLNLVRLGATAVEYLPDFYGPLDDAINAGDPTDRLFVRWDVAPAPPTDPEGRVRAGRGHPRPGAPRPGQQGALLVEIPADIEALRASDPAAASRWRYAVRDSLGGALGQGYQVTGFAPEGRYKLTKQ